MLALVALVVSAVLLAFALNSAYIGTEAARLVCQVLTLGTGDCGASAEAADREPTTPCLVSGESDRIRAGLGFTFAQAGADRGFAWEELSDGTYRVKQTLGADGGGTVGVGATFAFTVADTDVGVGASASAGAGVRLQGGQEWLVSSREELQRLTSAENWSRVDQVVDVLPGGFVLPAVRGALGIGEQFPPPDRVFVEGGVYGDGAAYAGAGAVAQAEGTASKLLGYSYSPASPGENTYYYRATTSASAAAVVGLDGASLEGAVETLVSVTVRDGQVVRANRTGVATGSSGGLTNVLFGEEFTTETGDSVGTGVQYDAALEVRSRGRPRRRRGAHHLGRHRRRGDRHRPVRPERHGGPVGERLHRPGPRGRGPHPHRRDRGRQHAGGGRHLAQGRGRRRDQRRVHDA